MRITGGILRGRRLKGPAAKRVRPTCDRVREALFQILTNRLPCPWEDVVVVDLFAGTGSLGIEALSRGAARAVFVESSAVQCKIIRDNIAAFSLESVAQVIRMDVFKWLKSRDGNGGFGAVNGFILLLADPPYRKGLGIRLAEEVVSLRLAWDMMVIEEAAGIAFPGELSGGFSCHDVRRYGDTCLHFFGPSEADEDAV